MVYVLKDIPLANMGLHTVVHIPVWLQVPANVVFHHWSWKQFWSVRTVCCWEWWRPQGLVGGRSA